MSLTDFRIELHDSLLQFLWRQWAQLGVAGNAGYPDRWIIDPEALLLASLSLCRYDPRLFDEIIDWGIINGRWLSVQRIKNIARIWESELPDTHQLRLRILSGFAAIMQEHESKPRWRSLLAPYSASDGHALDPLFLSLDGSSLPIWGAPDPYFEAYGIERPPVSARGLSQSTSMQAIACLVLKLRALFGLGPRAESMVYLLTHDNAKAPEIARATGYSVPAVREALAELAQGGFIYGPHRGLFQINADRWRDFLELGRVQPVWIDWLSVFSVLLLALDTFAELDNQNVSAYIRASRLTDLSETMSTRLVSCGLPNPFLAPVILDNVETVMRERITTFVSLLSEGLHAVPHASSDPEHAAMA